MDRDAAATTRCRARCLPAIARRAYDGAMSGPHDLLFKGVLSHPEHARGVLRAVVPTAIAQALDWAILANYPGSFVDPLLTGKHTDLLFSIAWRGANEGVKDALVYLLFEHQSTSDRWMAFRLLRYLLRIWDHWLGDHPRDRSLPIIVPVVLYHGQEPWSAPVAFDALFDVPEAVRQALAPHLVQLTYLLDNLSDVSDDQLRARPMTALGRLVEVCFKHARNRPDLLERLSGWADVLFEVINAPNGLEALELIMRYILRVNDYVEPDDLRAFLERMAGPDAKETVMTAWDRLEERSEQRGEERGIQKGERAVLLRLLRQRFGARVDADAERRLATASAKQIDIWLDRVLSAPTLTELLAD
jgi:predicted transposase/invertase (TIGR01784 family)